MHFSSGGVPVFFKLAEGAQGFSVVCVPDLHYKASLTKSCTPRSPSLLAFPGLSGASLRPGGENIPVTLDNLDEFLDQDDL